MSNNKIRYVRKRKYVKRSYDDLNDDIENMPKSLKIGNYNYIRNTSFAPVRDSTHLWKDNNINELKKRLASDGYLFVRQVIDPKYVVQARSKMIRCLNDKHAILKNKANKALIGKDDDGKRIPGWTVDAETGGIAVGPAEEKDDQKEIKRWRSVGNSTELTNVYNGPDINHFCKSILGKDAVMQTAYTWLRMRGHRDVTAAHCDYFYFKSSTSLFGGNSTLLQVNDDDDDDDDDEDENNENIKKEKKRKFKENNNKLRCELCHHTNNDNNMVTCTLCNHSSHINCLKPSLKNIPEGEWHCNICANSPLDVYTCWIPLGELDYTNGTLALVPGTHKLNGYTHDAPPGREVPEEYMQLKEQLRWEVVKVQPGDLVLFNIKTVHAASANKTNEFRLSLDTRVVAKPLCPRLPLITSKKQRTN